MMSAPRAYSSFIEGPRGRITSTYKAVGSRFQYPGCSSLFSLISQYGFTLDHYPMHALQGGSLLMWITVRYDQVMRGALLDSHLGRTVVSSRVPLRAQTSRSAPGNSSKI